MGEIVYKYSSLCVSYYYVVIKAIFRLHGFNSWYFA